MDGGGGSVKPWRGLGLENGAGSPSRSAELELRALQGPAARVIRRRVIRFLLGFGTASCLWAAVAAVLYANGVIVAQSELEEPAELASEGDADSDGERDPKKRKRPRRAPRTARAAAPQGKDLPRGEATTGDDLNWDGQRQIDLAAGEAQLSGKQIESGFDGAMSRIRRCLVLVPAEGEVTGKLIFGMRVGADGQPRAVNLTGPAVVTSGESGSCLRQAAQAIRFAKFDGPDMLFRYPITLQ